MMDRTRTGRCAHRQCPHRAVRAGVCLYHWYALMGKQRGPWPADLQPVTSHEYVLRAADRRA